MPLRQFGLKRSVDRPTPPFRWQTVRVNPFIARPPFVFETSRARPKRYRHRKTAPSVYRLSDPGVRFWLVCNLQTGPFSDLIRVRLGDGASARLQFADEGFSGSHRVRLGDGLSPVCKLQTGVS